jgi:hypothetical protein
MNDSNNKLVQYVREIKGRKTGELRGVVVAIPDKDTKWKVGWAFTHFPLDTFDKKRGLEIALGRCASPTKATMPRAVEPVFAHMVERAEKYYK